MAEGTGYPIEANSSYAPYHAREIVPLEREDVEQIIEDELHDSVGGIWGDSEVSEQRRDAMRYYFGQPFGNEIEGRSQVVLTDVADTIEWIMPSIMRMLVPNGKRAIRMKPKSQGPAAKENARKASLGVNQVLMEENQGFLLLYETFKTALLEKVGFVKTYFEERLEPKKSTYLGLDEYELGILLEDESLELVESKEREPVKVQGQMVPVVDVTVQNKGRRGQVVVEGVPPEEVLISRRSVRLNSETGFSAHQKLMTIGDLLALGVEEDLALSIPPDDPADFNLGREERFEDEEWSWLGNTNRSDVASQKGWVTECYIRIDEDGDGYSELRKILCYGYDKVTILIDEEINRSPWASFCPVPVPFKFFGRSLADLVMDLQKIRSVLLRAMMDNLFLANNPKTEVVEGQVNLDDLLTNRPGGVVRVRQAGQMREVETKGFPPMAMAMMEFLEGVKENRTGSTRYNQGQDASSLNQTASGLTQIMTAAAARVEMIGRIFALTGMKDLGENIFHTMRDAPLKPFWVQLDDGEWEHIDPNDFNEDMQVEVVVGLGVGAAADRVQHVKMILDLQAQLHDRGYGNYLVKPEHVYNATEELTDAMNFEMPNQFFAKPEGEPPPKETPYQVQVQQLRNELEAKKLELANLNVQVEAEKEAALVSHRANELAQTNELETKRMELDAATRIRVAEIQADATLEAARSRPAPKPRKGGNGVDRTAHA